MGGSPQERQARYKKLQISLATTYSDVAAEFVNDKIDLIDLQWDLFSKELATQRKQIQIDTSGSNFPYKMWIDKNLSYVQCQEAADLVKVFEEILKKKGCTDAVDRAWALWHHFPIRK